MIRLGPGFYLSEEGTDLHVDVAELAESLGIEPTAENQEDIVALAREQVALHAPDAELVVVGGEEPTVH